MEAVNWLRSLLQRFACWRGRHDLSYVYSSTVTGIRITVGAEFCEFIERNNPDVILSAVQCDCCGYCAESVMLTAFPLPWGKPPSYIHPPGHA